MLNMCLTLMPEYLHIMTEILRFELERMALLSIYCLADELVAVLLDLAIKSATKDTSFPKHSRFS